MLRTDLENALRRGGYGEKEIADGVKGFNQHNRTAANYHFNGGLSLTAYFKPKHIFWTDRSQISFAEAEAEYPRDVSEFLESLDPEYDWAADLVDSFLERAVETAAKKHKYTGSLDWDLDYYTLSAMTHETYQVVPMLDSIKTLRDIVVDFYRTVEEQKRREEDARKEIMDKVIARFSQ